MINMFLDYESNEYKKKLNEFTLGLSSTGECNYKNWGIFKEIHLTSSKNKCPICECRLDGTLTRSTKRGRNTSIIATIDHYRPQEDYPFLRCDHKNYLLMCSECNQMYKKSNFPLYPSGSTRWSKDNFVEEKPLIINPMLDNPLELFILVFRNSQGQDILELQVKDSLKEVNDYLYQKAKKTISVFGLGNCEDNEHENPQVHNCRLRVLNEHFGRFYELAKARKKGIGEFMKALRDKPTRAEYGFIEFIAKEKFEILT